MHCVYEHCDKPHNRQLSACLLAAAAAKRKQESL